MDRVTFASAKALPTIQSLCHFKCSNILWLFIRFMGILLNVIWFKQNFAGMYKNQFSATGYADIAIYIYIEHACGHLIKWLPLKPAAKIELILIIVAVQIGLGLRFGFCDCCNQQLT